MKEILRVVDVDIADEVARSVAAGRAAATNPAAHDLLTKLYSLMEAGFAEMLSAADMQFELQWLESIPSHARLTMSAQVRSEMQAHISRSLRAQVRAMVSFQTQCIHVTTTSLLEQLGHAAKRASA